jgi:hypothetical protein
MQLPLGARRVGPLLQACAKFMLPQFEIRSSLESSDAFGETRPPALEFRLAAVPTARYRQPPESYQVAQPRARAACTKTCCINGLAGREANKDVAPGAPGRSTVLAIDTRDSTRSGWLMARSCAIMAPILNPDMRNSP